MHNKEYNLKVSDNGMDKLFCSKLSVKLFVKKKFKLLQISATSVSYLIWFPADWNTHNKFIISKIKFVMEQRLYQFHGYGQLNFVFAEGMNMNITISMEQFCSLRRTHQVYIVFFVAKTFPSTAKVCES